MNYKVTYKVTTAILAVALVTVANYAIWQNAENSNLELLIKASDTRNNINLDENRELHKVLLHNIGAKNDEIIKNQGRIEGIVDFINRPDDYFEFWHQGYQRGLDQNKDMEEIENKIENKIEKTPQDIKSKNAEGAS